MSLTRVKLSDWPSWGWAGSRCGWARGAAHLSGASRSSEKLAAEAAGWQTEEAVLDGLRRASGCFALVSACPGRAWAAVDSIRSLPLYWAQHGGRVYLSDDPYWLREQVGGPALDPVSVEEFLRTGYVTGPDTLLGPVKQLQAGEALFVRETPAGPQVHTTRYYRHRHGQDRTESRAELVQEHDRLLQEAFGRLVESAAGRPLVIPLSGGFDSRLVAFMLKRLDYPQVLCYSYGTPENEQAELSRRVAEHLDYEWHFVEYTSEAWARAAREEPWTRYGWYGHGAVSAPHIQDWLAVGELQRRGCLPPEAVFVPGHSYGLPAGSSIPERYERPGPACNLHQVTATVLTGHYRFSARAAGHLSPALRAKVRTVVSEIAGQARHVPRDQAASICESWNWQERQAKLICNSVRVYEFWGYEWLMPLWDAALLDFWQRIPFHLRLGKALHWECMDHLHGLLGCTIPRDQGQPRVRRVDRSLRGRLKRFLNRVGLLEPVVAAPLYQRLLGGKLRQARLREYHQHSLRWYGWLSPERFLAEYGAKGESINSFLARERLQHWRGPAEVQPQPYPALANLSGSGAAR